MFIVDGAGDTTALMDRIRQLRAEIGSAAPMRQLAVNAGVPAQAIDKAPKSRKEGAGIDPATGKTVPMRPHAVDILPVLQSAVTNAAALTIRLLTG